MTEKFLTHSAEETGALAQRLVQSGSLPRVVALEGNLGAGKTVFVKGMAKALGITRTVQSPTFVVMKVYEVTKGKLKKLVHVDCYRLSGAQELRDIGLEDYLGDPGALVVIEWADKVAELLPADAAHIVFEATGENERQIIVSSHRDRTARAAGSGTRGTGRNSR